jgi:uncharacterized protein YukJ
MSSENSLELEQRPQHQDNDDNAKAQPKVAISKHMFQFLKTMEMGLNTIHITHLNRGQSSQVSGQPTMPYIAC